MGRALLVMNRAADRDKAHHWVKGAPPGTRIEFKAPKRSLPQNDKMWAMLTEVSLWKPQGRIYTADQWKVIFMHACGRTIQFIPSLDGQAFIPWGQSSSDLSKSEMNDLIEFMFSWAAENGFQFTVN